MDVRLERALAALREAEEGPGTSIGHAPLAMTLLYPSPYRVAMSSLGYLQIHRLANARQGTVAERAVLPEPELVEVHRRTHTPLLTIESRRPAADADLIGISLAYELELAGLVTALQLCGIPPLAADRDAAHPLIVLGGPLTFSNPLPAAPFADVLILGEAEGALDVLLTALEARPDAARASSPGASGAREALLDDLAGQPGFYIPTRHGERLPVIGQAPDALLPAFSGIRTPNTELASMQLIEPERGCHRGCTFCVMRQSTNGGMRLVPPARLGELIAAGAPKVGLVGAAVTDHPKIKAILRDLIETKGKRIGISSLRADRLDDELVGLLAKGGYRSMTVALDAASERLRHDIEKNLKARHVIRATELARAHNMRHIKIYTVVNLPGETDDDLAELIDLANELSRTLPVVIAVSPFVPKFHTPLARAPFAGEKAAARAIDRLRKGLRGRAQVRGPGGREAYVEYRLSQGGWAHAHAAIAVAANGGSLGAWKRALKALPERFEPENIETLVPPATKRRPYAPPRVRDEHGPDRLRVVS